MSRDNPPAADAAAIGSATRNAVMITRNHIVMKVLLLFTTSGKASSLPVRAKA
jgi:hypothetical protein